MKSKNNGPLGPEIIIVLGAGIEDGSPTPRTIARTKAAAELASTIPGATIIVSGDGRTEGNKRKILQTEASHMAHMLLAMGIRKGDIRLEHQALDTSGNFVLAAARYLIGETPRKVHVVTSPFHGERAMTYAQGLLGPDWHVQLHVSTVCDGDEPKGANEGGGIEWAQRFCSTVTAGDITSAIDRLLAIGKPQYRAMRWLVALASTKAA